MRAEGRARACGARLDVAVRDPRLVARAHLRRGAGRAGVCARLAPRCVRIRERTAMVTCSITCAANGSGSRADGNLRATSHRSPCSAYSCAGRGRGHTHSQGPPADGVSGGGGGGRTAAGPRLHEVQAVGVRELLERAQQVGVRDGRGGELELAENLGKRGRIGEDCGCWGAKAAGQAHGSPPRARGAAAWALSRQGGDAARAADAAAGSAARDTSHWPESDGRLGGRRHAHAPARAPPGAGFSTCNLRRRPAEGRRRWGRSEALAAGAWGLAGSRAGAARP